MSFTSPYPDVEIPNVSVYEYLFGGLASDDLDRPALIEGSTGAVVSFGELIGQIDTVAGALAARGLRVGDVAAVHVPNMPAFAAVLHGILRAGGTATTMHPLATAEELSRQLADSRARFMFTVSLLLPSALAAARSAGIAAERVIVLDGAQGHESLADLLSESLPAPTLVFDPAKHLAVLPYSSGTTGNPKGVMLTHRNLVANLCQIEPQTSLGRDDRMLAVLPFFHIYGLTLLLNGALRRRATLVTMIRFDLAEFLRIAATHRCTHLPIAPPIAVALAKSPLVDEYDLSSVRLVLSGAAALDEQLGRAVADRLGSRVRQGYGMTEMSPASHGIPEDRDDIPLGSVGLTLPNMRCKLVDTPTGVEIPFPIEGLSASGELCCKGPNIMVGYLGNEAATAEVFDDQGFLRTGDIAVVDSNGVVYIVDRVKELIKHKGYQVPPAELEALLLTHPLIADAAVIGVTDADGQEIPKAYVVRQPGADLGGADVMAFVAGRVAPHKKIRRVEFLDAIPKSITGKILRKDLRARDTDRRTPA
ncbi:AMP-binding protein [Nocardia nepalensis]|uniref:AMP-binding protein n=1 Tax=Nocardia nepalensis TaxID=3375448 RepID=UPI003B676152